MDFELSEEFVIKMGMHQCTRSIYASGTDMASACISFSLPIMSLMLLMILLYVHS